MTPGHPTRMTAADAGPATTTPATAAAPTAPAASIPKPKPTGLVDLPALALQGIISRLAPAPRMALRRTCKRTRALVDASATALQLPIGQLRRHAADTLSQRFPAAHTLSMVPDPRQPAGAGFQLTKPGRKAAQAVIFFDCGIQWPRLAVLDLSCALGSCSRELAEAVADCCPGLVSLALPPPAAVYRKATKAAAGLCGRVLCGRTHVLDEAAGAEGVVQELQRLHKLVALRLRGWEAAEQLPSLASLSGLTALDAGMAGACQQQPPPQQPPPQQQHQQQQHQQQQGHGSINDAAHHNSTSGDQGPAPASTNAAGSGPSASCQGTWTSLLRGLPGLRHLQLANASASVLEQLAGALAAPGAPAVRTLVLPEAGAFAEEGDAAASALSALGTMKRLVQLELWSTPSATATSLPALSLAPRPRTACLRSLPHLSSLSSLSLGHVMLDGASLGALQQCVGLERLRLLGLLLEKECDAVLPKLRTLEVAMHFDLGPAFAREAFPQLTRLHVRDAAQHGPILSSLKRHAHLEHLSLHIAHPSCQLSELDLGELVGLPCLHKLELTAGGGGDSRQWLPSASLCQLCSLSIVGAATDHTLSLMAKHFSNVQELSLTSCYYVTDWGVKRLGRLASLESVHLELCPHVTDFGLQGLMGHVPTVSVTGCDQLDERACSRARRALRRSGVALEWQHHSGLQGSSGMTSLGAWAKDVWPPPTVQLD